MIFEYNATQEKCPLPLVKLRLLLKKMTANDSCLLQLADKGSIEDIPKLLTKQNYHFAQKNVSDGVVELLITCSSSHTNNNTGRL